MFEKHDASVHDYFFGEARDDVERLFDHFGQKLGAYDQTAALLTLAVVLLTPESTFDDGEES